MEPNIKLAELALKGHHLYSGEDLDCDEIDENGNHLFYFGDTKYDWNGIDSSYCVYAVLKPIVENGELVRYEIVEVEEA